MCLYIEYGNHVGTIIMQFALAMAHTLVHVS